jgi:hypothetical protein
MFGDLELDLRWNFKVPHALGVLIHLQIPKSKIPTNFFEFFRSKKAKFRCLVI